MRGRRPVPGEALRATSFNDHQAPTGAPCHTSVRRPAPCVPQGVCWQPWVVSLTSLLPGHWVPARFWSLLGGTLFSIGRDRPHGSNYRRESSPICQVSEEMVWT